MAHRAKSPTALDLPTIDAGPCIEPSIEALWTCTPLPLTRDVEARNARPFPEMQCGEVVAIASTPSQGSVFVLGHSRPNIWRAVLAVDFTPSHKEHAMRITMAERFERPFGRLFLVRRIGELVTEKQWLIRE